MNTQKYLQVALTAARETGPLFKKYFGAATGIEMKNNDPRNLVTEIDKKIETRIRQIISKNFPDHKIIGEEFSKDTVGKSDLVWIIDPIDGTTNYIQGLPLCCISIALWNNLGPLVATLYNPVSNQLFTAQRGLGAKLNGKKIAVSKEKNLGHALGGVGWLKVEKGIKLFSTMARNCRKLRVLATSAWQICLVGSSNYDFYLTADINIWDFAAAILIAEEAGGKATDITGGKIGLKTTTVLVTNGQLHKQIIQKVKDI